MTNNKYAIEAKGIHKSFGKVKVLQGINFKIERGTIMAVLGPNGAGKTTMVRILSTLLAADEGKATVEGLDVNTQANQVRSIIGLTGQYAAVDEYLTGRENLRMMGRLYHLSKRDSHERTEQLLAQFDLVDAADRTAKTYSGGMRRRLDLAASLIASPAVLFLDEPTTGLDPRSRLAIWDIIKNLTTQGSTILLTTQYLEEADLLANRIVVIDGGKVIAEGTADELKKKVGKERVELNFKQLGDFQKAVKIVDSESNKIDEARRSISITNDGGVHKLRILLEKFEKAKVPVDGLSLHKPTLDDVFLKLTGHGVAKDEEESSTPQKKGGKK